MTFPPPTVDRSRAGIARDHDPQRDLRRMRADVAAADAVLTAAVADAQADATQALADAASVDATLGVLTAKGADIASAATTDLAAATGAYVHITGNATIASFGTVAAGVVRKLVFDGTPTLTYHATQMILPGAADVVVAAGDSAEFISEGSGNWKCFSYQRAATAP